jgi:hypothetical protein
MENKGFVNLWRKLKDKGYYKNASYVHLWVHLLLSANFKEKEFLWNDKIIKIKEGQLLTGRKVLSHDLGIPETSVERMLDLFEKEGQIRQQKTQKFRIITILNWHKHQKADNRRTTDGQQTDTNNNDNNEKNISSSKKEDNTHKDITTLFSYYKKKYIEWVSDEAPIFNWGQCEKLARPHIKSLGLEKMKHLLNFYLKYAEDKDREFWKKNVYSLKVFLSADVLNKLNVKYGKK